MKVLSAGLARVLTAGVVGALGLAVCGGGPNVATAQNAAKTAPTPVKIGYLPGDSSSALFAVANQQHLWQKYGLKPELETFTSGPLVWAALKAGDIQIGHGGIGAMWPAMAGQADLLSADVFDNADVLIAQPSSGVHSIDQLKGKDVDITTGTATDLLLRLALARAGIPFSDVHAVNLTPDAIVSAFSSKRIQFAGSWYPLFNTILAKVPGTVVLARSSEFAPHLHFFNGFLASHSLVTRDPGLVSRVMMVLEQAGNWVAAHSSAAFALTARFNGVSVSSEDLTLAHVKYLSTSEFSKDIRNGHVASWLEVLSRQFVAMGVIHSVRPVSSYFPSQIYLAAAKKVS